MTGPLVPWDPLCQTIRQITERIPYLLVWHYRANRLYFTEAAVAKDLPVDERGEEKRANYRGLKGDLAAQ